MRGVLYRIFSELRKPVIVDFVMAEMTERTLYPCRASILAWKSVRFVR